MCSGFEAHKHLKYTHVHPTSSRVLYVLRTDRKSMRWFTAESICQTAYRSEYILDYNRAGEQDLYHPTWEFFNWSAIINSSPTPRFLLWKPSSDAAASADVTALLMSPTLISSTAAGPPPCITKAKKSEMSSAAAAFYGATGTDVSSTVGALIQ